MGTVFGKNTTSASITVAGHKVYYIDSTDAEIVEVEGQGGGGSTASDDATGTISGVTLPTAHSYTGVSFDSLRYYVKGTLSNTGSEYDYYFGKFETWYKGTITWTDETIGDLSDRIVVNPPGYSIGNKQTTFKIIFIDETRIGGTHAYDTGDSPNSSFGYVTDYTYSNGVHSITYWYPGFPWYVKTYSGRIQFRYLDGVTTFNNLSAFDLVNVSGGSLSKVASTDRYDMYNAWGGNITLHALYGSAETIRRNAFKYTLSGTPYWYVIDGEHDTWTDDLSAWGYSEVPVGPVLPEVGNLDWFTFRTGQLVNIGPGPINALALYKWGTSLTEAYDSNFSYAIKQWNSSSGIRGGVNELSVVNLNSSGILGAQNDTQNTLSVWSINIFSCSSNQAMVVTVYDSSNVAYNAFKFTANNTDYYYVLDGTQTDWTDDLAGIGYYLSIITAYVTDDRSSAWVEQNEKKLLFNSSGSILYGNGRSYYLMSVLLTSGTSTTDGFSIVEPSALFLSNAGSTRKVSSVTIAFI